MTDVGVGVVELLRVLTRPGDARGDQPAGLPAVLRLGPRGRRPAPRGAAWPRRDGWRLDLAALEAAFATHPAAYVLCNPHNPVGRVHTADELAALVRLARIYRVTIVSDEIHAPLVLPGATFTPLLTVPGAAEVAVSVVSASKAWNLAGLKCAAVVTAAPRMAAVVGRFPPDTRWRIGHLGVIGAVAAFTDGERLARPAARPPSIIAGCCSATCCASAAQADAGTRPRRPSWPGWTAPPSARTTGPGSGSSTTDASRSSPACGSAPRAAATRA